jgi:hypothetical protein
VTDLFWSHTQTTTESQPGLSIHAFPLYPVQAIGYEVHSIDVHRPRKYLANFVGAYNPSIYISSTRDTIFKDTGRYTDLLIVKRSEWHYDKAVYNQQLGQHETSSVEAQLADNRALEYINAIQGSWFTLCPTGSGPNSLRIYEALAFGSIPIVLTRDLCLPGPVDLWHRAAIFAEDNQEGYHRALSSARQLSVEDKGRMLLAGAQLYRLIQPNSYSCYIRQSISK